MLASLHQIRKEGVYESRGNSGIHSFALKDWPKTFNERVQVKLCFLQQALNLWHYVVNSSLLSYRIVAGTS